MTLRSSASRLLRLRWLCTRQPVETLGDPRVPGTPERERSTPPHVPVNAWVAEWIPLGRHHVGIRRGCSYWVTANRDGLALVYLGPQGRPPERPTNPQFYINGDLVHRDVGFEEGSSSVPYLRVGRRRIYPAEGHPLAGRRTPLFDINPYRSSDVPLRLRANPAWRRAEPRDRA